MSSSNINRSQIFTTPDPELVAEGSVDPMGMQMIWTYFGQKIFNNKLTTVSVDIRNYTINLIHHYVLYRLEQEHSEVFNRAKSHFTAYNSAYDIKAGLLILMEDLLVYSLIDQKDKVETKGLLGSNIAENNLQRYDYDYSQIELEAQSQKGILVRQIQLGVNGRYKGPFINMGLMSKSFEYNPSEFDAIHRLFINWEQGNQLAEKLLKISVDLLNQNTREHPRTMLNQLRDFSDLRLLNRKCFGQERTNKLLKEYWLEKLGLNHGAAHSIFKQIGKNNSQSNAIILAKALESEEDPHEQELIQNILDLEPFLSRCVHAFNVIADVSVRNLGDVQSELENLIYKTLIEQVQKLTLVNPRLKLLLDYTSGSLNSGTQFGEAILAYHKKIMEDRGGSPWVEIRNDQVKHNVALRNSKLTEEVTSNNYWYNGYYLGSLKEIYKGLSINE